MSHARAHWAFTQAIVFDEEGDLPEAVVQAAACARLGLTRTFDLKFAQKRAT